MFSKLVLIGLGPAEIIVILVVAFVLLVILGPKNLPKLGNSIGKGIKGLRKGMSDDKDDEDKDEVVVEAEEVKTEPKKATTKTAKKSTTTAKSGAKTTKKKVVKKKSE